MVKTKVINMNELVSEYVLEFLKSDSVEGDVIENWIGEENQKKLEKLIKVQQKKDEKKKAKKQEKKNKHKDEPKKAKSAYICFCTEKRQGVKDGNDGISNTDIMTVLGKLWKELNEDDKEKWQKVAAYDKKRYEDDLQKFYDEHPEEVKVEKSNIKKPVSSYVIFSNMNRAEAKKNNPELSPKQILSLLGSMWKKLTDVDKEEYNDLAAEDKARYKRENSGDEKETKTITKEKKAPVPVPEHVTVSEPKKDDKPKGKVKGEKKKVIKA